MIIKVFFLVFLTFLKFSHELDCSTKFGPICEGYYNTKYKYNLKCLQFTANEKCVEVEIDEGCRINDDHSCVKTDTESTTYKCYNPDNDNNKCKRINVETGCELQINSNKPQCSKDTENIKETEDCFLSEDQKTCEKKTKLCNLYSDNNCGGLAGTIINNKQCIFDDSKCKEITIDDNCQFDKDINQCVKQSSATFDEIKNKCIMDDDKTECKLLSLSCNDYSEYYSDLTKCSNFGDDCHKIKISETQSQCKTVTIESNKCEINNNGECTKKDDQNIENYQKCSYNNDYTKCELINKECSEMAIDACSACKSSPEGYTCSKVNYDSTKCINIIVDSLCEIDSNGECVKQSSEGVEDNNKCNFIQDKSKCQYYEVDPKCKLTLGGTNSCSNGDGLGENEICDFIDTDKTKCKPRDKICSDFNSEGFCNIYIQTGKTRCFWVLTR
jgi:hypothetical protein